MNLEDALATFFATILGPALLEGRQTGVSSMPTLCNCGRRSPSQGRSKGSIQRREIGVTPGGRSSVIPPQWRNVRAPSVVGDTHSTFQGRVLEARRSRSMPIAGAKGCYRQLPRGPVSSPLTGSTPSVDGSLKFGDPQPLFRMPGAPQNGTTRHFQFDVSRMGGGSSC